MSDPNTAAPYTNSFYKSLESGARNSAEAIIPLILELTGAESVVDVGCASGIWLDVFRSRGVQDILGLDGPHVAKHMLAIPPQHFVRFDLSQPFYLGRTFDLVLSLEVAEHLPEQCAAGFVNSLTQLGPVIVFSAAIPFQGGTNHLNEQWPDYWANLFTACGYVPIDCLRRKLWRDERVDWWYAQNMLIFVQAHYLENHARLKTESESGSGKPLSLIHPKRYLQFIEWCNTTHYDQ